jgi:hypothetical protein
VISGHNCLTDATTQNTFILRASERRALVATLRLSHSSVKDKGNNEAIQSDDLANHAYDPLGTGDRRQSTLSTHAKIRIRTIETNTLLS